MNVDRWFCCSCSTTPRATANACSRPGSLDGDVCGGQGTCINATLDNGAYDAEGYHGRAHVTPGTATWGANGEKLAPLSSGTPATGTTGIGDWSYYEFDVVLPQQYDSSTKVAMLAGAGWRESGDPVLFVKADSANVRFRRFPGRRFIRRHGKGFRTRLFTIRWLLSDAKPGKYYIAVFNNNRGTSKKRPSTTSR